MALPVHPLVQVQSLSLLEHRSGMPAGCDSILFFFFGTYEGYRRRATNTSQVAKPNSTRAAGAGGSSSTMLKLYTEDSIGLRVYVLSSFRRASDSGTNHRIVTLSLS